MSTEEKSSLQILYNVNKYTYDQYELKFCSERFSRLASILVTNIIGKLRSVDKI